MAGSTHARTARLSQSGRLAALFSLTVLLYLERSAFPAFVNAEPLLHNMSKTSAGRLMSWFYVGYFLTQLPGGWLAWRYGGDVVLIRSTLVWGLLTVVVSDYGDLGGPAVLLPLLRVAIGCLQGVAFPAIHSILADTLAAEDRPRAVSLVTSGMYAGTALAQLGLVEGGAVRIELAWIGALAVGWAGSYHMVTRGVLVASAEDALHQDNSGAERALARRERPSLSRFLRSPPVVVLLLQSFAFHWTFYTLLSWLPFLYAARQITDPTMRAMPFVTMWFVTASSGFTADRLAKTRIGKLGSRKVLNCGGLVLSTIPAHFIGGGIGVRNTSSGHGGISGAASAWLITMCLGFATCARGGFGINHMDLAPQYAGILLANCTEVLPAGAIDVWGKTVVNSAGTVAGVVGVAVAGAMLESNEHDSGGTPGADQSNTSSSGWSAVFGIAAAVSYLCAGLFAVFASVDDQFRTRGKALHDGDPEDVDVRDVSTT